MINKLNTLIALCLLSFCTPGLANSHPLNVQDLSEIEALQRRVSQLEFDANVRNQYALNKAKAWLDFALIEYHDRDHTGIVQDAITEANRLLSLTNTPASNIDETLHPKASERVRLDLWEKVNVMKQHAEHSCADKELAELEVQLVWAGHEKWEAGWEHAAPYIKTAENLAYEAKASIDQCVADNAPKPIVSRTPEAESKVISIEKRTLATDTMFAFNQYGVEHLVLGGKQKLNLLITELNGWKSVKRIMLTGHTDRIGSESYNLTLAEKRADKIKQYLIANGLSHQLIEAVGIGKANPIVDCKQQKTNTALIKCLQPNRRVELVIEGEQ